MTLVIALVLIYLITGFMLLFNRISPFRICPICAGVCGTWIVLVAARILGQPVDMFVPTALAGGSIVGIAYQSERKRITRPAAKLIWKTLFIPPGFVVVYLSMTMQWLWAALGMILLSAGALAAFGVLRDRPKNGATTRDETRIGRIMKGLDECC